MRALWIILTVAFLFAGGGLFVFFGGNVELQPTRVLNPTNFSKPEEIGAIVFRRFWQELHTEKLVVVGSSPFLKEYDRVWLGFLSVANESKLHFDKVFTQPGLRQLVPEAEPLDWEKVQLALINNDHVLVHVVSTEQMQAEAAARTTGGFLIFQNLLEYKKTGKKKKYDPRDLGAVIEKTSEREHQLLIHERD